jgi:glycosyltransferase involved in cell wall biosynthesis
MFDALGELRNPKTYTETSDRARAYANRFSWDSVGKDFNSVVEGMLNESR